MEITWVLSVFICINVFVYIYVILILESTGLSILSLEMYKMQIQHPCEKPEIICEQTSWVECATDACKNVCMTNTFVCLSVA